MSDISPFPSVDKASGGKVNKKPSSAHILICVGTHAEGGKVATFVKLTSVPASRKKDEKKSCGSHCEDGGSEL